MPSADATSPPPQRSANPWGTGEFQGTNDHSGRYELPPGKSFQLHFRILLHSGDEKQAGIAAAFAEYAQEDR